MECQEPSVAVKSDDDTLPEGSHILRWCGNEEAAWNQLGPSMDVKGEQIKSWMEKAGLTNITAGEFKTPIGTWHADPKLSEIGGRSIGGYAERTSMADDCFLGGASRVE